MISKKSITVSPPTGGDKHSPADGCSLEVISLK
jgi:hypothetical protein